MLDQTPAPRTVTGEFGIGRIIGRTVRVVLGNLPSFFALALATCAPVLLAAAAVATLVSGGPQATLRRDAFDPGGAAGVFGSGAIIAVAACFAGLLLIASLMYGAFHALKGGRAPVGASLRHGLASVLPVSATAVVAVALFVLIQVPLMLVTFALTVAAARLDLGAAAMLLPATGHAIFTAYGLAGFWMLMPVAVVEGGGIAAALGRSWQLTRGTRWHTIAIILLSLAGFVGLFLLLGAALGALQLAGLPLPAVGTVGAIIGGALYFGAFVYFAVLPSVGYYYLKHAKEGVEIDDLFAVFD